MARVPLLLVLAGLAAAFFLASVYFAQPSTMPSVELRAASAYEAEDALEAQKVLLKRRGGSYTSAEEAVAAGAVGAGGVDVEL